jgi:hypothetical protein
MKKFRGENTAKIVDTFGFFDKNLTSEFNIGTFWLLFGSCHLFLSNQIISTQYDLKSSKFSMNFEEIWSI